MLNLVGCTNAINKEDNSTTNQDNQNKIVEETSPDISYMGMRLKDESVSMKSSSIFNIQTDEQFAPSLEIKNGFDSNQKYRVIFLIDYKPITFLVDGREHTYFDFNIDADAIEKIDIIFPKLVDGQHDLTTVIIREPEQIFKEPIFVPGFEHILAHRSNIIVSTDKINPPEFIQVDAHSTIANYGEKVILNQGSLIDLDNPISLLHKSNLNNIWISFENESDSSKYAVIILDIIQIKSDVEFVSTDTKGIIKRSMDLPDEFKSTTNLVVLAVENPFTTNNKRPYLSNKISLVN
ncbi:hypothetical protein [Lederbergia graminis]|uniref:hypothetical protein n=1 Tax=Lederbergia graminis TaxID=735518 RepID=UPI0036D437FA